MPDIIGYRALSDEQVALINAFKMRGNQLAADIDGAVATGLLDPRWVAIGRTHLQQGLMALNRAVAQPEGF